MNLLNSIFILVSALLFGGFSESIVHADTKGVIQFHNRIDLIQREAASICKYIEETMMPMARQFKLLIYDARPICPAFDGMEKDLANIGTQADRYSSAVAEQSYICQKQLYMLKNGLESGAMLINYMKTGNYTLSSEIVDKWHQSFENFSAKFHVWHIPMDIMLANKKIFDYENWITGILLFICRIGLIMFGPAVVAWFLTLVLSRFDLFNKLNSFTLYPEQAQKVTDDIQLPTTINGNPIEGDSGLRQRYVEPKNQSSIRQNKKVINDIQLAATINRTPIEGHSDLRQHHVEPKNQSSIGPNDEPKPSPLPSRTPHWISISFLYFAVLFIVISSNPQVISSPQAERYNWYPDATKTLETMKNDLDILQANVSRQTTTLIEFQRYVKMHLDEEFQGTVKEFVANVIGALKQANTELLDTYAAGVKLETTLSKAYDAVEAKAKKTRKMEVATKLLNDLSEAKGKVEILYRHLYTATQQQIKVVPVLKTQTESMRYLLRNHRFIEIGELAEKHEETVIDIDGEVHKVTLVIEDVLDIVGMEGNSVIEKETKSLQKHTQYEQYKSWAMGTASILVGGGGVIATGMGLSVVTVIAAPAIIPLIGAAGVFGSIGLGAFGITESLSKYYNEAEFKAELKDLKIVLNNFMASMQRLKDVTDDQKKYLESTRSSLRKLAKYCSRYTSIAGFIVPDSLEQGITDELDNLIVEYTRLIASYSLFTDHIPKKAQIDRQ